MVRQDEALVEELFETALKYNGRTYELFVLAASNIQEKSKLIDRLQLEINDKK